MKLKHIAYAGLVLLGASVAYKMSTKDFKEQSLKMKIDETKREMNADVHNDLIQAVAYRDSMEAAEEGVAHVRLDSLYNQARERAEATTDSLDRGLLREINR